MKKCNQCGAENQDGAKFCGMCRASLAAPKAQTPRPRLSKLQIAAVLAVFCGLIVYFSIYYKSAESPALLAAMSVDTLNKKGNDALTAKNYTSAIAYYQQAALKGDAAAENFMGWFYQNGLGVKTDNGAALDWYKKAAAQGSSSAETNVGWCYQNGLGVATDTREAIAWYQKAIALGNDSAEINMGFLYENGIGVTKDLSEAHKWYKKAADQGNQEAKRDLDVLEAKQVNLNAILKSGVKSE
ncbi:MAG TPA: zinc-ribbon domain-containing protein [bacterium]|nr:zinc-ribbon domain-containing protein [bacterium]